MEPREHLIRRTTVVTVVANLVLSAVKIAAGVLSHSGAIIADGIHSLSDVLTTVVAYIGMKISIRKADANHPYGHERFEPAASKLLAVILILTAAAIIYRGYRDLRYVDVVVTSNLAIYAAILSIVVKEWMYHYTIKAAKAMRSNAFKADAWHHRTDALSSVGALIGVGGARLGYGFMEPIATIVIGILIVKVGVDIYLVSLKEMTDTAADTETVRQIETIVGAVAGIERVDLIRTRQHGSRVYVDIEIAVDGGMTLYAAHAIAQEVHDRLEHEIETIKHCMVHVNPV